MIDVTLCSWDSRAPSAGNNGFYLSRSVSAKQSGPKPGHDTSDFKQRINEPVCHCFSFFLFWFLCQGHRSHCASDLDQWGLKTRRSAQGSASWGSEWCTLKLWGGVKSPENWNFWGVNRTFMPERKKIQILITWKLNSGSWQNFCMRYAPRMRLRGWSHGSPEEIQDGHYHVNRPLSLILEKSAPNFMGRCNTATHRWPRDQKSKPEVNSRDVIKRRSEAFVRRSQWL